MLKIGLILLWLRTETGKVPAQDKATSKPVVIDQIARSGRCADLSESPDSRVKPMHMVAPGQPPLLSFRYFEGKLHYRYGNQDLMLDDAGH